MTVITREKIQDKVLDQIIGAPVTALLLWVASVIGSFKRNLGDLPPEIFYLLSLAAPLLLGILSLTLVWGLHRIHSRQFQSGITLQPSGVVRPEGYHLDSGRVLLYGTFLFFGGTQVLSFIAGILGSLTFAFTGVDLNPEMLAALLPTLIFGQAITALLVSQWIGTRVHQNGLLTVLAVISVGRLLLAVVDILFLGYEQFLDPAVIAAFIGSFLMLTIMFLVIAGIGYWRGTKMREAGYVWYLLSNLPQESRVPLEELLYDEVRARVGAEA